MSNLFKNLLKALAYLLVLQTGYLFSQADASFFMAGYSDEIDIYNFRVTTSDNGSLDGGFRIEGEALENDIYTCYVNFNDGGWYNLNGTGSNGGNTNNGTVFGNGRLSPYWNGSTGTCQINFSHTELVATDGYPGNVDGITMKIRISTSSGSNVPEFNGTSGKICLMAR